VVCAVACGDLSGNLVTLVTFGVLDVTFVTEFVLTSIALFCFLHYNSCRMKTLRTSFYPSVLLILVLLLVSVGVPCVFAKAQDNAGTASATFLKLGQGARASAMGEAFTAQSDGAGACYWNPAGLADIDGFQLTALYNTWIADIYYGWTSIAVPVGNIGTFAGSFLYLGMDKLEGRDDSGGLTGESFAPISMSGSISYSRDLSRLVSFPLAGGISGKYVHDALWLSDNEGDNTGKAFALDIGLLAGIPSIDRLKFGLAIQNMSTGITYNEEKEKLPVVTRVGLAAGVLNMAEHTINLTLDGVFPSDNSPQANAGLEYWFHKMFAVRVGYRGLGAVNNQAAGGLTGLTAGAGLKVKGVGIDFAWVPYGYLAPNGNTFRAGITLDFGKFKGIDR
jgi:hypothetical protein